MPAPPLPTYPSPLPHPAPPSPLIATPSSFPYTAPAVRETPWIIAIGCAGLLALTSCSQTNRPVTLAQASGQGAVVSDEPSEDAEPEAPRPSPRRDKHLRFARAGLGHGEGIRPRTPEAGARPAERRCPQVRGAPNVYMIGSSTMGTLLGPMLKRLFGAWDVESRRWGKASSGLARPDFHDWPKEVPELVRKYDPDVFVVSLGTNDFQPIKTKKGWIRTDDPAWDRVYAERVDRMLKAMSAGRQRTILWIGPTAFASENARKMAPRISDIVKQRVAAFGGPVTYIDAYRRTLTRSGALIETVRDGSTGKRVKAYQGDGIHLTTEGVRWLLAEPVLRHLAPCLGVAKAGPLPRRQRDDGQADRLASNLDRRLEAAAPPDDAPPTATFE